MKAKEFVSQLERKNEEVLAKLGQESQPLEETEDINIRKFLKIALTNEMEASELAAYWMHSTPEVDVKLGLARQVGDEAKHYKLIADRLEELGEDLSDFDPLSKGYSPVFEYLKSLDNTIARVAAGQFTREAIALVKNEQFIDFCHRVGDSRTAQLYEVFIQPDETFHHRLGKRILEKYAQTDQLQIIASEASQQTLELAEELRNIAFEKSGIRSAPGC